MAHIHCTSINGKSMSFSEHQMSCLVDLGMPPDATPEQAGEYLERMHPHEVEEFQRATLNQGDNFHRVPMEIPQTKAESSTGSRSVSASTAPAVDSSPIRRQGIESQPAQNQSAPAVHARSHESDCTLEALQAGLLMREGIEPDSDLFKRSDARKLLNRDVARGGWLHDNATGNVSQANKDRFSRAIDHAVGYSSYRMVDFCREALRLTGRPVPRDQGDMIQRALSTSKLTAIFSPLMTMGMIEGYAGIEDTTLAWTRSTDIVDFKQIERARLTKASGLAKQARGGTANPIEFGDEIEKYRLARYSGKFEVSEEDIIDDSFGGLNEHTMKELGELAGELRGNLVYSILMGNPTMRDNNQLFHPTHGNLLDYAFGQTGAELMKVGMRTQTENGRGIRNKMKFLIVPEALEFKARQLVNSGEVRDASSTGQHGTDNPHNQLFEVVADPRLDNGVEDPDSGEAYSGSATAWFGASALNAGSIEVGYRSGTKRSPRMTDYMLAEDRNGIGWRIDLDIAAKAIDWRAISKSDG